jgi:hypothetical protein
MVRNLSYHIAATRPDKKGLWTIEGTYTAEESGKEQLVARVTSRGKVLMTNLTSYDLGGKLPEKPSSYEQT